MTDPSNCISGRVVVASVLEVCDLPVEGLDDDEDTPQSLDDDDVAVVKAK